MRPIWRTASVRSIEEAAAFSTRGSGRRSPFGSEFIRPDRLHIRRACGRSQRARREIAPSLCAPPPRWGSWCRSRNTRCDCKRSRTHRRSRTHHVVRRVLTSVPVCTGVPRCSAKDACFRFHLRNQMRGYKTLKIQQLHCFSAAFRDRR
jgi:hypothetical protein